jgi:hypothetical protein
MDKISGSYIKKCIQIQDEIRHFRMAEQYKKAEGEYPIPKPIFKVGDRFHNPSLMEEGEVEIVKEVIGNDLYASNPTEPYPKDESILIPTADQIRVGLEVTGWSLGDVSSKNEEELLDEFMRSLKKNEE